LGKLLALKKSKRERRNRTTPRQNVSSGAGSNNWEGSPQEVDKSKEPEKVSGFKN